MAWRARSQNFPSDKYVKAFCAGLEQMGIGYTASAAIEFITPGRFHHETNIKQRRMKK